MSTVAVALDPETEEEEEAELNKSAELAEEGLLRALTLPELLTTPRVDPVVALQEVEIPAVETPSIAPPPAWPCPLEHEVELLQQQGSAAWPDLSAARSNEEVEMWIRQHGKITVRAVTWNLAGKQPPAGEALARQLVPPDRYHLYVIGTEECERSIAASALNPSKKNWEDYLGAVLGPRYIPLRSHTLQAIHLIVFAHIALAPMCKDITSAAVATGVANTLGNKGGLAVSLCIGSTKFVIVNAHLAAHQNAVKRRNSEFQKLRKELPLLLAKRERSAVTATAASDQSGPLLENCADRVIFMGDLNYRVRGNRSVVDKLLQTGMHDVMLANDQLKWSIGSGFVFEHFTGKSTPFLLHGVFPLPPSHSLPTSPPPHSTQCRTTTQLSPHVQVRL